MSDWVLPVSFVTLLAALRPVFTSPSYDNFRVLIAGWVHALGRHRISDVVRAAGTLAFKHFGTYYRFFSEGRWSLDQLGISRLREAFDGSLSVKVRAGYDDPRQIFDPLPMFEAASVDFVVTAASAYRRPGFFRPRRPRDHCGGGAAHQPSRHGAARG